jgi:alkylation response protein AidB-like acyl-CoA dehydrogenase
MTGALQFSYSEEQEAMRAALDRFCTQQDVAQYARQSGLPFPRALWRELADLGVFAPASPGNREAGGALAVCAIAETLGAHVFPGPVPATFLAIQVLDPEAANELIEGRALLSLSSAGSTLLPWGVDANLFLVVGPFGIARACAPATVERVQTLGGEAWGRATLTIDKPLADPGRGFTLCNLATAAYLTGAAWRLLRATSAHAAIRKQFGKTLGEFQAVTQPLADCATGLTAAQNLARAAACHFDSSGAAAGHNADILAAAAVMSARRSSLHAANVCHQVFAGIGITLEGPAFYISRRLRQLASTPPLGMREQNLLLSAAGLGA